MNIHPILKYSPFLLSQAEKEKILLSYMQESVLWHYHNNIQFKNLCDNRNFDVRKSFNLYDIPYIPVPMFKSLELLSVPRSQIIKTLYSSSTSGKPSKIMIDKITSDNQAVAANKILADYLGKERRLFLIFDIEDTIKNTKDGELSSRGTAIRGMLSLAKNIIFLLDQDLSLSQKKIEEIKKRIKKEDKICFFGFTWLIYKIIRENKDLVRLLQGIKAEDKIALHLGGWKKLTEISVGKDAFNKLLKSSLGIDRVIDLYGMTEQLGTIYLDCEYGFKHMPVYSDIIIRDFTTLKPLSKGQAGFIQLISPLPYSYPGISILSDDIGKIIGTDDCMCGRKGKYFLFEKRSEKAELKGCGDTINLII